MESVPPVQAVEPVESVRSVECVRSVESVESVEPVEAAASEAGWRDPYGLGPDARISVGGYFPRVTGRPGELSGSCTTGGDGPLYAVAFVVPSRTEHAVPWSSAVPGAVATAACTAQVRVAGISGSRVIWMPGVMMCGDCAVVVGGARRGEVL
ncbi:hypothetical protein AB0M95_09715 [Sphaerisporangium sp. NPDC051017]|uniref:hypothetical protein n=1 Tax=Sphaerisporangium sp. NPDC051017 TaxID=3154636 RepID=UPI0034333200